MQTVVLDVEGMKCGGCVSAVERTLLEQPGVQRADVNLVSRAAWLDFSESEGNVDAVLEALAARGFPAHERSLEFQPGVKGSEWIHWLELVASVASVDGGAGAVAAVGDGSPQRSWAIVGAGDWQPPVSRWVGDCRVVWTRSSDPCRRL